MNIACFLNIHKHIMVFLFFSTVKKDDSTPNSKMTVLLFCLFWSFLQPVHSLYERAVYTFSPISSLSAPQKKIK